MPEVTEAPPVQEPAVEEQFVEDELSRDLQLNIVDVSSGVTANASDHAEHYIAEQTSQHGFKGFLKRIWHGNLARDYIRQRTQLHGKQAIVESGNIFSLTEGTQHEHDTAMASVVTRFAHDFIHSGESKAEMREVAHGEELEEHLRGLVKSYAEGELDRDTLHAEKTRLLSEYGHVVNHADRNKGLLFADNVLAVAENARAAFSHGVGLERIDEVMSTKTGEAKIGARTEARRDLTDRIVDKLYAKRPGTLVNETTIALAAGVVATAAKFSVKKATTAAGIFLGAGVGAGVIAGVREHARIGQERQLHLRERATGLEAPENMKKRGRLEATRYETVAANTLQSQLETVRERVSEAQPNSLHDAIAILTAAQTRITLSDENAVDLIDFSGSYSVEHERLQLDISLAAAKIAIRDRLESIADEELSEAGLTSRDLDQIVQERTQGCRDELLTDISAKDRAFSKLRRAQTIKMGAVGLVTSVIVGDAIQEIKAAFEPSLQGVFEHADNSQERRTMLAGLLHKQSHSLVTHSAATAAVGGTHVAVLSNEATLNIPNGYNVTEASGGHWNLVDIEGKPVVDNITLDSSGHLSEASQQLLGEHGFSIAETNGPDSLEQLHTTVKMSPHEYLQEHPNNFTHVERQLWYDNNTPGVSDQNELRMDWGGHGGSGLDSHGNYVFNVSEMTESGSFHNGLSANAQQLMREGKLVVALSMTKDTQNSVFLVHIDEHGSAVINAKDFIGKSLFTVKDGKAHFIGAYAEAAQIVGKNAHGATITRMLATVVGSNHAHVATETIAHTVTHQSHEIITTLAHAGTGVTETARELPIEVPIPLPIYSRHGLESRKPIENLRTGDRVFRSMYYSGRSLEELRLWLAEDPSRLRTRRLITHDDGSQHWVEADGSAVERSVEREREVIENYLLSERDFNPDHFAKVETIAAAMPEMDPKNRVSVNIPAWMEAENLYQVLSEYVPQTDDQGKLLDERLFEINILINRKTGTNPDDSVAEVERYIADFEANNGHRPRVNYYDVELDPPLNNVGYARKLLTDAVVLRSVQRDYQDEPLYIETEDADLVRVDKRTVHNVISKLDFNPQLDAIRGVQDRSPEYLKQNDLLFLKRRAADYFEVLSRSKKFRNPESPNWDYMWNRVVTGGWNSAYTAETYGLIHGYEAAEVGEDMYVGEKISMIRGDGQLPNLEVIGTVGTRTDSSPRRYINEIVTERGAYTAFADEADNKVIRERSIDESLALIRQYQRITPENKPTFDEMINSQLEMLSITTANHEEELAVKKRFMFWLGFEKEDYQFENDRVDIKSWDNVEKALARYRARHPDA